MYNLIMPEPVNDNGEKAEELTHRQVFKNKVRQAFQEIKGDETELDMTHKLTSVVGAMANFLGYLTSAASQAEAPDIGRNIFDDLFVHLANVGGLRLVRQFRNKFYVSHTDLYPKLEVELLLFLRREKLQIEPIPDFDGPMSEPTPLEEDAVQDELPDQPPFLLFGVPRASGDQAPGNADGENASEENADEESSASATEPALGSS